MNNKQIPSNRRKSITVGLVICFVAVIGLAGTYTFKQYKDGVNKELQLAKEESERIAEQQEKAKSELQSANSNAVENEKAEEPKKEEPEKPQAEVAQEAPAAPAATGAKEVTFSAEDKLLWPISGDILMNFSMDKTTYFATLDQYKYNPAVVIAGGMDEQVVAATSGIVKAVETSAQTGVTITMEIGSGYEVVYGQLKEVSLEAGAYVERGAVIGKISEPTKYYSVEGSNLYFQMRKDGNPVNPLDFLDV